ncbi:hypothetical protein [Mucilaginibacter sp.]|uniref:hypothetical protein n=1 Tax=Mucilaginibacter sp. TaxID=1882438 RepID=UPI000CA94BAD|nr:hypothetical protein [Mucilaginibacter sp.]PLW88742.1 MAG: hypothetical protein C0154_15165 [Mucilaginibacter sp.]PMP65693.1 MAG: hypothetical protein C0191_02995 [Mucilaginibacter sp.]HEK20686.1 hypothetical protein [Bacteroidota bacterium]
MEKKLIKFYQVDYDAAIKRANMDLARFNDLLMVVKADLPDFELTKDNFNRLLSDPKELAFDVIMAGKNLEISGVPIGKEKAMGLIEYPAAWIKVIAAVVAFNHKTTEIGLHKGTGFNERNYERHTLKDFVLDKNAFVLCSDFCERIKSRFSVYTQSEKQNKALEHLSAIHEHYMALKSLGVYMGNDMRLKDMGFSESGGALGSENKISFDPTAIIQRVN